MNVDGRDFFASQELNNGTSEPHVLDWHWTGVTVSYGFKVMYAGREISHDSKGPVLLFLITLIKIWQEANLFSLYLY